jgi:enoyl-CoA hydratase
LLGQLDKGIGAWLSLVGARIKAYDLMKLKLITHYVSSSEIGNLKKMLISSSPSTNDKVDSIINSLSSNPNSEDSVLIANENIIKDAFSFDTIEQIFEKCESLSKTGNEFLNAQLEELKHKSPTSLKISLKQIRDASKMTLKDELIMEYRMVQRCLEIGDFFEGVRAMLVDKDRKPNWQPSNIKDVDEGRVNKFFEVLGNLDLVLTN